MAHFVEVKWDGRDREQIGRGIRYISHREERLEEGRTRELYGIGPRYRAMRGDESAIREALWKDGEGLHEPRYHRGKLTVDDAAARRLARLSPELQERALRDAVEKSFQGVLRRAQGVFAVHAHGGRGRAHGHPHAHFRLSPLLDDGRRMVITPRRLATFKERWTVEVDRALTRAERREQRGKSERFLGDRKRDPDRPRPRASAERTAGLRRVLGILGGHAGRTALRRFAPGVGDALRVKDRAAAAVRDPARALGRAAFRLATSALPAPLRTTLSVTRVIGRLRQDD